MPVSNFSAARCKKVSLDVKGKSPTCVKTREESEFLTIASALPILPGAPVPHKLTKRSQSSISSTSSNFFAENVEVGGCDVVSLQWTREGKTVMATRTPVEREKNPDRICLDRRGLTMFPTISDEPKLRLLSLQHNLLTKIEGINFTQLTKLVFLDLYDNQIEKVFNLDPLENLRVLLIGKNRIKKIEGLNKLMKLEVLDLHGNQIVQISGLEDLEALKVLNLAGNNIKVIGCNDFQGLISLKELNLKRNKIKKLLGFGETPQLQKLYLSNNDIQKIEDMGSLAKALQIREITIDGNPVTLNNDYISFLVAYLPNLQLLSAMQITEQIRRAAMAWRTNKEQSNSAFLDLSTEVCMNIRREQVISNAKTNWELLRYRPKPFVCNNNKTNNFKHNNVNTIHLHHSSKCNGVKLKSLDKAKSKGFGSLTSVNENVEANKIYIKKRSNSSDNLLKLEDTMETYPLEFKLPPILGSIIDSLTSTIINKSFKNNVNKSTIVNGLESETNTDSESSESHESLKSGLRSHLCHSYSRTSSLDSDKQLNFNRNSVKHNSFSLLEDSFGDIEISFTKSNKVLDYCHTSKEETENINCFSKNKTEIKNQSKQSDIQLKFFGSECCSTSSKTSSVDSIKSLLNDFSSPTVSKSAVHKSQDCNREKNRIKSGQVKKMVYYRSNRAATARAKFRASAPPSPPPPQNLPKDREQGGDYLIEIVGRFLNIYGQSSLRFVDRQWDSSKVQYVNTVKFNYVQFNSTAIMLNRLKNRFPNVEHFIFRETNISYLGQLNALAEVQGLTSIQIEPEGNPIVTKDWRVYAIFRLAHWGLKIINGKEITEEEIESANEEYAGLVDIVTWSLPESLLQPLLQRLRLDKVQKQNGEQITAKQFLFNSDPALKNVVAKEALQWRKSSITQEDLILRHKGKIHLTNLITLTIDAMEKLQILEKEWPTILCEIVRNTLSDFSDMNSYLKRYSEILESNK